MVADHEDATVAVLDLLSEEVLASFSVPGPGGNVYRSPSGQYGLVVHRDENRVTVVHSGLRLEDHGDHADLVQGAPYILQTLNVGRQPTHVWTGEHEIAIFNDADGTVAVLDERLFGLSLEYLGLESAGPDHGAAVVLGDHVLVGYLELGRVDAFTRGGELETSFEGCPRLHGEASAGDVAAFGCADGVLLVTYEEGALSAVKLDNPAGTPEDARVGTVVAHEASPVMVGNLGDGVVLIDAAAQTLEPVSLPSAPLRFAFDHTGEHLLVLTRDGELHRLEAQSGELQGSVSVMEAFDPGPGGGHGAARPGLAVGEHAVYVSVPSAGEVAEVRFEGDALSVTRRLEVGGTPSGVALLALEGGVIH